MSVHPLTYNNDLSCLTARGSIQKVHNNRIKDQKTIAAEDYETQLKTTLWFRVSSSDTIFHSSSGSVCQRDTGS